ncbi:MAG: NADH-quinone oxidoreductase subunit L [Planctomycetota bacterium]
MTESASYLWWIVFVPLLGSVLCGALHLRSLTQRRAGATREVGAFAPWVACGAMALAFALSVLAFLRLAGSDDVLALESSSWAWLDAGSFELQLSMVVDRLSSVMALVVTGVGLLIHVYSAGYMRGDPGYAKYFAFLNLFVFAMLLLVLSSNLMGLFIGWEGVGLCSYLLIGFWYEKGWPAEAGQKAFVVNRIGDACFLLGSFILLAVFGTLDLSDVGAAVPTVLADQSAWITAGALLLFGGACGKSAQFPLFTWLPDAMAGPTPVSALIHAATMVTAGVYLIVRLNPLFAASATALAVIGVIGALTALIGASSALLQNDIKKVLAYSTVSQLGYMFLALSSGAWIAAIFHLTTHAFFKALLFLGSGSVIHGMHEEQDMRKMGGLRKHMPTTFLTFLVGAAALSGLPPFSGYWSKDEILAHTFGHGGLWSILWIVGVVSAAMTAFYTWRMVALTFFGKERFDVAHVHPHESPASMTIPLIVLAVLAAGGGLLGLPHVFHVPHVLANWLEPVVAPGAQLLFDEHAAHLSGPVEWSLLAFGALVALYFAHRGFHTYKAGAAADAAYAERSPAMASFLAGAWKIDEAYTARIVEPMGRLARFTYDQVDQRGIDGVVNGTGRVTLGLAARVRLWADGDVKHYALWVGAGAAALTVLLLVA